MNRTAISTWTWRAAGALAFAAAVVGAACGGASAGAPAPSPTPTEPPPSASSSDAAKVYRRALNEFEDASAAAMDIYRREFGNDFEISLAHTNPDLGRRWSRFKTQTLIDFGNELIWVLQQREYSISD